MPALMVSSIPLRVIRNGADAVFVPDVPIQVRDSLIEPAKQAGAKIVEEPPPRAMPLTPPDVELDPIEDSEVAGAITRLLEAGKASAFGNDNKPKLRALKVELGRSVTSAQRDSVWDMMNDDPGL